MRILGSDFLFSRVGNYPFSYFSDLHCPFKFLFLINEQLIYSAIDKYRTDVWERKFSSPSFIQFEILCRLFIRNIISDTCLIFNDRRFQHVKLSFMLSTEFYLNLVSSSAQLYTKSG